MSGTIAWAWQALIEARPQAAAPLLADLVALAAVAMLVEAAVLLAWHRRTGRGLPPRTLLPTVLAGGCLMGALHAALSGAPAGWLVLLLAAAGTAHVVDLRRRWPPVGRRQPRA